MASSLRWTAFAALGLAWACGIGREDSPRIEVPDGSGGAAVTYAAVGVGPSSGSGSGKPKEEENPIPDPEAPCDSALAIDAAEPLDAARAIGLCQQALDASSWGIMAAAWVRVSGDPPPSSKAFHLGHGILPRFGDELKPLEGARVLALSSGTARAPKQKGWVSPQGFDKGYASESPQGFPKESPSCPGVKTGETRDDIALELVLRPPPGAQSFAFDFDFFTYEWPQYVCSKYNDFFVALLHPAPKAYKDGNVSFDQDGNPVSVNNALLQVCDCEPKPPCAAPPNAPLKTYACKQRDERLDGTGFEEHAATGWLVTKAPVAGEEVRLRLGIYDSGDGVLDSTVVLDNFRWLGDPADVPQTVPKPR